MARCGGPLNNARLLVGWNSPGSFPALDGRRSLTDHVGRGANAAQAAEKVLPFGHGCVMYEFVAQHATTISYRQCARFSLSGRMSSAHDLKALRNRTEPRLTSRALAERLGMPPSTYAANEDPAKNKKPILPLGFVKQLVPIFAERGVPEADTLKLAGVTGELTEQFRASPGEQPDEWVEVIGVVQAGVWREQSDWSPAERYDVRFGPNPMPGRERFGIRMEGLSMNKTIPPGSDLECLRIGFSRVQPAPGSLVIVARNAHDLVEMTCKRLEKNGDEWVLRCESTEPEFQDDIPIGKPDEGMFDDREIRIVGLVLSAKQDLAPPGYGTRRYRQ